MVEQCALCHGNGNGKTYAVEKVHSIR
jgi:hypothetical protein